MKSWINILFYIICFFVLAMVIYRLAFCVPPLPGEPGYAGYCTAAAVLAVIVSGLTVGLAFAFASSVDDKKKKK